MMLMHCVTKDVALLNLGQYNESIGYFDKALGIDPVNGLALYNKGLALFNLGKYNESIGYYDKVLAIDPEDVDSLNYKGAALTNWENPVNLLNLMIRL